MKTKCLILLMMFSLTGCAAMGTILSGAGNGLQQASHEERQPIRLNCTTTQNGVWITTDCRE